jgi:hypothetical protein
MLVEEVVVVMVLVVELGGLVVPAAVVQGAQLLVKQALMELQTVVAVAVAVAWEIHLELVVTVAPALLSSS